MPDYPDGAHDDPTAPTSGSATPGTPQLAPGAEVGAAPALAQQTLVAALSASGMYRMPPLPASGPLPQPAEIIRALLAWLNAPTERHGRRALEAHPALLDPRVDAILESLHGLCAGQPEVQHRLHQQMALLRDARARGATAPAIRDAYVAQRGGLALEVPPWLEALEARWTARRPGAAEDDPVPRAALLRDALAQARADPAVAPATGAALGVLLWEALEREDAPAPDAVEEGIACLEAALGAYTHARAPLQWARVQHHLGAAYTRRLAGDRAANVEQAISCYQSALLVYTQAAEPLRWAGTQNNLANAYEQRIVGDRAENAEQAIACYHAALQVYTRAAFPRQWAATQHNLGAAYAAREAGERGDDLERAIACFEAALQVATPEDAPRRWADAQNALGTAYRKRLAGDQAENLERSIACFEAALRVYTRAAAPMDWAGIQNNLGVSYRHRVVEGGAANRERAIACFEAALQVFTPETDPLRWARAQNNLGNAFEGRGAGEREENLERAIGCYLAALRVYTQATFPVEHRDTILNLAFAQAERGDWVAAHAAYTSALAAEDALLESSVDLAGRDAILRRGREAALRDGYALARLGRVEEAAVAIERGRARGLATARTRLAGDARRIADAGRRARYVSAREALIAAHAPLHAPIAAELPESERAALVLARNARYRQARAEFDAVVEAIRQARDPADFLDETLGTATILRAVACGGFAHALVYLVATPWGGVALAALGANPAVGLPTRFAQLALPRLTSALVDDLIEVALPDGTQRVVGGYGHAQAGTGFELLRDWPGATVRARAAALHRAYLAAACPAPPDAPTPTGLAPDLATPAAWTLDAAAQELLAVPELAPLTDYPLDELPISERALLAALLNHALLQRELTRCLECLGEVALRPLVDWLQAQGVGSLTLIPCGPLSALPLAAAPLADGRAVGMVLPTSVAPSARALLPDSAAPARRASVCALGNPYPTAQELPWGEAEAQGVALLARRVGLPGEARVQFAATRAWLLQVLQTASVVEVSCHGAFDLHDVLRSCLLLANGEELTLADLLSKRVDLHGLRLLILSACQTAALDLRGARDEVRSLTTGVLQAGAEATLAALWRVDDRATYLLMLRFAQEWLPNMGQEAPAAALGRAQRWLRDVTNRELRRWQTAPQSAAARSEPDDLPAEVWELVRPVFERSAAGPARGTRFDVDQAQRRIQGGGEDGAPDARPFADPYYWAAFQVTGW